MTAPKKTSARTELDRIKDALVEAILSLSEAELRDDMRAAGQDPDKCLVEINALIDSAKAASATQRFDRAKSNLADWRSRKRNIFGFDREDVRARFAKLSSRDPELGSKMMMAARNGKTLSDSDMEGLLEDLARLEQLDGEDDEG